MAEKDKKTFNTRLHECCAGKEDKLRPYFQCVHFENGYGYATNGKMAIKQTLSFHTILNPQNLDGHSLPRDSYREIMGFEYAEANAEGVTCWNTNGQQVFFAYYEPESENDKKPDIERMFQNCKGQTQLGFIGIDTEALNKVKRALYLAGTEGVRLQFTGVDKHILIDVIGVDKQKAILMPTILENTLF